MNLSFSLPKKKGHIRNDEEQAPWLAVIPVLSTVLFYLLPPDLQQYQLIQFLPQLSAYLALGIWSTRNSGALNRLGMIPNGLLSGINWGVPTGLLLGAFNTVVILWVVPNFGGDILFLRETPHAHMPFWIMVPWGIVVIAVGVELNFRGFLLGRLDALFGQWFQGTSKRLFTRGAILAVCISALVFACDPFMVMTFKHLHWIAVWDGLIWGCLYVRTRNLYVVVVAHAVEVVILYSCIKAALM